jgi:hypothetical protein
MEPRHDEPKDQELRTEAKEAKPRRFRIVKLEERIAPGGGGHGKGHLPTKGICCVALTF